MIREVELLADAQVPVRTMSRPDLIRRKTELEGILAVLSAHTLDEVCAELGEISYATYLSHFLLFFAVKLALVHDEHDAAPWVIASSGT